MTTWHVGDVTITAIVEMDMPAPFAFMLPAATPSVVEDESWLFPTGQPTTT